MNAILKASVLIFVFAISTASMAADGCRKENPDGAINSARPDEQLLWHDPVYKDAVAFKLKKICVTILEEHPGERNARILAFYSFEVTSYSANAAKNMTHLYLKLKNGATVGPIGAFEYDASCQSLDVPFSSNAIEVPYKILSDIEYGYVRFEQPVFKYQNCPWLKR